MKSIDDVTKFLDALGVGYTVEPSNAKGSATRVRCGVGAYGSDTQHAKVGGYTGFYTAFEFDVDGTFIEIGAWE